MNTETLTALKASIAKWERNAEEQSPYHFRTNSGNCPLCVLFIHDSCRGCPVFEKTGEMECKQTPYRTAVAAKNDWFYNLHGAAARAHAAARDEVAFLKSLLPEEHQS